MSDRDRDTDLARQAADLAGSLRELQRELEPDRRRPRPPTPRELMRFTDEVAIPGLILILETNIRALKLLQRSIRLANPDDSGRDRGGAGSAVRDRAVEVSQDTLSRLDSALADLQEAIEGRPENDDAREVLDDARSLRAEINDRLAPEAGSGGTASDGTRKEATTIETTDEQVDVPVDVDAELQSLKEQVDDDSDGDDPGSGSDDG